jgi:hypothetical protein
MYIQSILAEMVEKLEEIEVTSSEKEKFIQLIDSYRYKRRDEIVLSEQ